MSTLVERIRQMAADARERAENNRAVYELLKPQLDALLSNSKHNVYAAQQAVEHKKAAERDEREAIDLENAARAMEYPTNEQ